VTLNFDLLTLEVVSVRVTCDVGYLCTNFSLPIGLSVLDLGPMYATDRQTQTYVRRQTSGSIWAGHNNSSVAMNFHRMTFWFAWRDVCMRNSGSGTTVSQTFKCRKRLVFSSELYIQLSLREATAVCQASFFRLFGRSYGGIFYPNMLLQNAIQALAKRSVRLWQFYLCLSATLVLYENG